MNGSITAVIPVKEPNMEFLQLTIDGLGRQTVNPERIIIVDCTVFDETELETEIPIHVVTSDDCGIGIQRREGLRWVDTEFVIHLDEDAVLITNDYIERGLLHASKEGVSAAGGVVEPIRGNLEGRIISTLEKMSPQVRCTHYLIHKMDLCSDVDRCFPLHSRGNDIRLRKYLLKHGDIVRDKDMLALKDLPTNRQKKASNFVAFTGVAEMIRRIS